MSKEQNRLIQRVSFIGEKHIQFIFEKLSEEFYTEDILNIEKSIKNESTELDSHKIELVKEILVLIIKEDETFKSKIEEWLDFYKNNQEKIVNDIEFKKIGLKITSGSLAMLLVYSLANNMIKAKYPNFIEDNKTRIERGYDSDMWKTIQSFVEND
jgi:hypothetical protein